MWAPSRISIFALAICLLCGFSSEGTIFDQFIHYVISYKKPYHNNTQEFHARFHIFKENLARIETLNLKSNYSRSAWYGLTKFSDLSPEEFRAVYLTDLKPSLSTQGIKNQVTHSARLQNPNIPKQFDWRNYKNKNYVSAVKNQNSCGACWAFSTVELVESMYSIQTGHVPPSLSVQEVIDCSQDNAGCLGGDTCVAMRWLVNTNVTVVSEKKYPLTDKSEFCKLLPTSSTGVKVSNYTCQQFIASEDDMLLLLANVGPLTVSVDATMWSNYQGGIIQHHCGDAINHAVVIVGYDLTGDVPYYIVRNSWGPDFGIHGYLYIKIGENICGIAGHVSTLHVDV